MSKWFEADQIDDSPTKPAPMTTILRFFSAEVLVEQLKHRCIPAFALTDRPLESIGRDVDSMVRTFKACLRVGDDVACCLSSYKVVQVRLG